MKTKLTKADFLTLHYALDILDMDYPDDLPCGKPDKNSRNMKK